MHPISESKLFEERDYANGSVHRLIDTLRLDVETERLSGPSLCKTIFASLLQRLLAGTPAAYDAPKRGLSQRGFGKYREWIDAHLTKPFSLDDLAADMGVSVRQLHREIRRATGMSPYRYILMERAQRARRLIVAGELTLSEIALAVGFYDHAHMSRTFRKLLGVPPSHFSNTAK